MAVPPQFLKKASGRRIKATVPSNTSSKTKKGGVATFANPGNKAGAGLLQKTNVAKVGAPSPEAGNTAEVLLISLDLLLQRNQRQKFNQRPLVGWLF